MAMYSVADILTMTQPPGSHHPLHGLHLTANKVPHTRMCVVIGHSQRESSPLHHGEVPTHAGDLIRILTDVFLSGGPEGEYDNEPNGPQLTKATYKICDVGYHTGPRSYGGQLCVGGVK